MDAMLSDFDKMKEDALKEQTQSLKAIAASVTELNGTIVEKARMFYHHISVLPKLRRRKNNKPRCTPVEELYENGCLEEDKLLVS